MNIHALELSPGTVRCKHHIVPQFTLMRMIYIYIAPFIPEDLSASQTKMPALHRRNVSGCGLNQPRRKNAHEHCLVVLSKRRFQEVAQLFHPPQTWLDCGTEIWSERPDMQRTWWSCASSAPAAGGPEVTLWWFLSVSQKVGWLRKVISNQ